MLKKEMVLRTENGLHSRAAATFVQHTNRFACDIFIQYGDSVIDAKSIMGIIAMGVKDGEVITLTFDGIDENKALDAIVQLLENEIPNIQ